MIRTAFACLIVSFQLSAGVRAQPSGEVSAEWKQARNELARGWCDPTARLRFAKFLRDQGDSLRAFYLSERLRRSVPAEDFAKAHKVVFLWTEDWDAIDLEDTLRKAAAENSDATSYARLGEYYCVKKDYEKSIAALKESRKLDPDKYRPMLLLSICLTKQGDSEQSTLMFEQWMEQHPDAPETIAASVDLSDEDLSVEEKVRLIESKIQQAPGESKLHALAFQVLYDAGRRKQAAPHMRRAVESERKATVKSAQLLAAAGILFASSDVQDNEFASDALVDSYFVDPHGYFSFEYTEARIRKLRWEMALAEIRDSKLTTLQQIRHTDPVVVGQGLAAAAEGFDPAWIEDVISAMSDDDPGNRWNATYVLLKNIDSLSDDRLNKLLKSDDLRVQGMALYLVAKKWPDRAVSIISRRLADDAQLIRYDALSNLLSLKSDGALEAVKAHRSSYEESNQWLAALLKNAP